MTFPLELSREAGLVVAVLLGLAFGFVLERAGFGRATKLAAQFYLRDMTVFKVMFTAIVTAMLGLVAASSLGLADLRMISEGIASWTWIWPMLIGGFVLGAGFIISGYCPGTSIVAAASGNVDGMFAFAGVVAGTFVYSRLPLQRFHESGAREAWFLYDLVPLPPAAIAIAIAAMAVLAFLGAEKVERIWSAPAAGAALRPVLKAATAVAALQTLLVLIALIPRSTSAAPAIETKDLRPQYLAEPWRYRIEGDLATDLATNRTYRLAGPLAKGGTIVRSEAPRPTGTFTKPKKKGGGCSS